MYLAVEVEGPAEGGRAGQQHSDLGNLHCSDCGFCVAGVWRLVTRPQCVALIHNDHLVRTKLTNSETTPSHSLSPTRLQVWKTFLLRQKA